MSKSITSSHVDFIVPPSVVSKRDLSRLISEFEKVDNELTTMAVREKAGGDSRPHPELSEKLTDFIKENKLSFDDRRERSDLIKLLHILKDKAPTIHMTFAVEADPESLEELVLWVRDSIHPQALVDIGLQPALVGGVYLRTPNHVHDFSLRAKLDGSHDIIVKELEAARGAK